MFSIGDKAFAALLFDMDGTIVNSLAATERVWGRWAERHGLDVAAFMPTMHGKRAVDTIAALGLAGVDAEREAAAVTDAEISDVEGVVAIAGAVSFLSSLPPDRWAIVTSAPRDLATARLKAAGIAPPAVLVTAEDVTQGKPRPDCYLAAAARLGVDIAACLVFEDAPAGIRAGEASGATVAVVTTTHARPMTTPHATLASYEELSVDVKEEALFLRRAAAA